MHERLGARGLAAWTLAFCAHRAVVLWWGFDGHFYWEETYRLLMAEALWHRWPWPILDVQADPYAGGSLVMAVLAVPVVAIVGTSLVGLKVVALVWSAVGFVAWTALVDRWWGRRAAHLFAFLFVFGPPLLVVYNLIAMGSHAEVATLAGVQLLLAYRCLYGDTRSPGTLLAWGIAAGFSTWFSYVGVLPFAVCIVVGIVGGALPARRLAVVAAGFVVGFAPWIATNLASGGRGLDVLARTFQPGTGSGVRPSGTYVPMLRYLLATGVPLGLRYPDVVAPVTGGAPRRLLLAHVYLALYALAWIALLARCLAAAARTRSGPLRAARALGAACRELPLLVLFPLLVAVLAATDQVFLENQRVPFFSFRLLVPILPAVLLVLAVATARVGAALRWPVIAVLAAIGVAGTVHVVAAGAASRPRLTADARALGAEAAGHLLYYKHGADMDVLAARIAAMPEELRGRAFQGVGFSLAYHYPETEPVDGFTALLARVPAPYRRDAVRGVRLAVRAGMEQVNPLPRSARTDALLAAANSLDPLGGAQ